MGEPVTSILSFQSYMYGYFNQMSVKDHLTLHARAVVLFTEDRCSKLPYDKDKELQVIGELLAESPWIVVPELGLVSKAEFTKLATKIASAVMNVCERQVSKDRPLSNINIGPVVEYTLREVSLSS